MGVLRHEQSRQHFTIPARCLVGRSPACSLRLPDPSVSGEHARLRFLDGKWKVRDLGSRNGTYINGQRLSPGESRALAVGDRIEFGVQSEPGEWRVVSSGPPVATARHIKSGRVVAASDGCLALPSSDRPLCTVYPTSDGWLAAEDGDAHEVTDGDVLTLADGAWMLHLPARTSPTIDARPPLRVADLSLTFCVSADEEHVEILVRSQATSRRLAHRTHNYLLLTLARERARDAGRADLRPDDHGWLYAEEICQMLQIDPMRLNTDVFRARREWSVLGVVDPTSIVERRRSTRQMRIGTGRVDFR